jgi:hypothetical protein
MEQKSGLQPKDGPPAPTASVSRRIHDLYTNDLLVLYRHEEISLQNAFRIELYEDSDLTYLQKSVYKVTNVVPRFDVRKIIIWKVGQSIIVLFYILNRILIG